MSRQADAVASVLIVGPANFSFLPPARDVVLCAAGFNIRWLLRAIAAKGLNGLLLALPQWALWQRWLASALHIASPALAAPTRLLDSPPRHTLVAGN